MAKRLGFLELVPAQLRGAARELGLEAAGLGAAREREARPSRKTFWIEGVLGCFKESLGRFNSSSGSPRSFEGGRSAWRQRSRKKKIKQTLELAVVRSGV